jgi:hypothetical protein
MRTLTEEEQKWLMEFVEREGAVRVKWTDIAAAAIDRERERVLAVLDEMEPTWRDGLTRSEWESIRRRISEGA